MSRKNLKRKVTQVDDVCDSLRAAKKRAMDEHVTSASLRLDCFSFIDKTQPTHSLTQIEFVAIDATKSESNRIVSIDFVQFHLINRLFILSPSIHICSLLLVIAAKNHHSECKQRKYNCKWLPRKCRRFVARRNKRFENW